jgi:murein biosynthesis integral membrane protein MurJ
VSRHGDREVVRQSGLTGIAAFAAILSGLVLDVSIAAIYGAGTSTDAFFVAARLPLGLVAIVMVGANQALVPAITTSFERNGRAPTLRLVSILLNATLVGGLMLTGLIALIAEPLMRITAPGLSPQSLALAASLSRVMFLVVPLVALAEILRAYLNSRYSFVAPAAMNVIMNGLAAALIIGLSAGIVVVAWAYVAGALAQAVFMLVMAHRRDFRYVASFRFRDPHVTSVGRLLVRPLIGASLNPLARVGEQLFTSFMPTGSITVLNYAYRLISAIGGSVMFRSVIVAIVPRLTSATAKGDVPEIRRTTRLGVKIMLLLSLPLTAFMAVLAKPAALVVFRRAHFTRDNAMMLGVVLAVYSLSLVGSAVQRAMLAPFFSRLDTRTPLRNTFYGMAVNMLLLPICVLPFGRTENGIIGIAIAYSLAQYVNVAHAWYHMKRDLDLSMRGIGPTFWRLAGASLLSGAAMVGGYYALGMNVPSLRWMLLWKTVLDGLLGFGVLAGALALFGGGEVRQLMGMVRKPRPSEGPGGAPNDDPTDDPTVEETQAPGSETRTE